MPRRRIHVYRYTDKYGDGLVFVDESGKCKYDAKSEFTHLGTLNEFIKKVKEEVAEKGVAEYWWEG